VRKLVRGAAVAIFAVVACRQVDPSGGAIDRAFGGEPRPSVPAGVDEMYDAFVGACARRDASAAWSTMTRDLQVRIDHEARDHAAALPLAALRARFGYEGHQAGFDGTAYLQGLLRAGAPGSPCPNADLWRRIDAGPDGDTFIVVAERPDGLRQAVRFTEDADAWRVTAISSPVDPRSDIQ
jgi:hypothetical protein